MSFAPLASCTLLHLAKENPARGGSAYSAFVATTELCNAAKALYDAGYHIEDVCGLDAQEGFVCVYHFDHFTQPGRVTLRVCVAHDSPAVPSIAPIFQGAEWHERETADFYGITFTGNPNMVPLLLPDDMAEVTPLRKDESARAPLHVLFTAADRQVLHKAQGFTLMDAPVAEQAPAAPAEDANLPAVKGESAAVVKAEAPLAVKTDASVAVKTDASLAVKPKAPLMVTPDAAEHASPADDAAQAAESDGKKAKAAVKKPAKAAGNKGEASDV